jgi:hypothetical protein
MAMLHAGLVAVWAQTGVRDVVQLAQAKTSAAKKAAATPKALRSFFFRVV